MSTVIAIEAQKNHRGRVNVFLDEGPAFSVSRKLAWEANLQEGHRLSPSDVESLARTDQLNRALDVAYKFLTARPRSETEITLRLRRAGLDAAIIQQTLPQLKEQGLVNDHAFAKFWRETRENSRPISRQLLALELKRKGIDTETIGDTITAIDDELNALHAAQKKARSLTKADYNNFHRRLEVHLRQRGFSFTLINKIIDQVWQEHDKPLPYL